MGSAAQRDASQKAARSQRQTNRSNLLLSLFSRGAPLSGRDVPADLQGREASMLPYYFGDLEKEMGQDAAGVYRAGQSYYATPELEQEDYQRILGGYDSTQMAADEEARKIFSGELTEEQLRELEPVQAERLRGVEGRKNAGLEALKATLNEISAIQAGKGFSSDSLANKLTRFNARRAIFSDSSTDLSRAMLENAMEKYQTKQRGRSLKLSNLSLPDNLARAAIGRKLIPVQAAGSRRMALMDSFKPFALTPGQQGFNPYQPNPSAGIPNYNSLLAVQGAQTLGNSVLGAWLKNPNLFKGADAAAAAAPAATAAETAAAAADGVTAAEYLGP